MSADLPERVLRLEGAVSSIDAGLKEVRGTLGGFGSQLDAIQGALTSTDGRAAERAHAVKAEIRDESDRKAKDRGELLKSGLALIGAIGVIVGALCGPYLQKLDATAGGQKSDSEAISGVRELIAQHSAEIARNRDSAEIGRDKNRWQDEQLLDLSGRVNRIEGERSAERR